MLCEANFKVRNSLSVDNENKWIYSLGVAGLDSSMLQSVLHLPISPRVQSSTPAKNLFTFSANEFPPGLPEGLFLKPFCLALSPRAHLSALFPSLLDSAPSNPN